MLICTSVQGLSGDGLQVVSRDWRVAASGGVVVNPTMYARSLMQA